MRSGNTWFKKHNLVVVGIIVLFFLVLVGGVKCTLNYGSDDPSHKNICMDTVQSDKVGDFTSKCIENFKDRDDARPEGILEECHNQALEIYCH